MATSEWDSREFSSTDSDSSTESEKEVKRVALRVCVLHHQQNVRKRKFAVCVKSRASGKRVALAKRLACIVPLTVLVVQENAHARTRLTLQATRAWW